MPRTLNANGDDACARLGMRDKPWCTVNARCFIRSADMTTKVKTVSVMMMMMMDKENKPQLKERKEKKMMEKTRRRTKKTRV